MPVRLFNVSPIQSRCVTELRHWLMQKTRITGVAEIVLSVADLPKMRTFYQNVMGFELHSESSMEGPEHDPDGDPTISFLTIAEIDTPLGRNGHPQLLALIDYHRHIHAKPRFSGHDVATSTLNHLAFEIPIDAFDDHLCRLQELGLEPSTTEFPKMKAIAIFFRDPESNVLELIAHKG